MRKNSDDSVGVRSTIKDAVKNQGVNNLSMALLAETYIGFYVSYHLVKDTLHELKEEGETFQEIVSSEYHRVQLSMGKVGTKIQIFSQRLRNTYYYHEHSLRYTGDAIKAPFISATRKFPKTRVILVMFGLYHLGKHRREHVMHETESAYYNVRLFSDNVSISASQSAESLSVSIHNESAQEYAHLALQNECGC